MKRNNSLGPVFFLRGFIRHFSGDVFIYLLLIPFLFSACAGKMSLEEARQVTVSMGDKSLTAPPRRIDDILSVLDQSAQDDPAGGKKLREEIDNPPHKRRIQHNLRPTTTAEVMPSCNWAATARR